MNGSTFQPGFRLSMLDVAVLIVGGVLSAYVMAIDLWSGFAIAYVVLHFFLFCNVLRMSRSLELVWAGVFAAMAAATMSLGVPSWPSTFGTTFGVTLVLAVIETRRPSYHGVGWQRLNPRLPAWWRAVQQQVPLP